MSVPTQARLSACIITLNEAERIEACVRSVNFCDEVVVVDARSSDDTCERARALGARVIEGERLPAGPARQLAVAAALHDWVLCVDADERVSDELRVQIETLRAGGFVGYAGWSFPRITDYFGRFLRHGNAYPDRVLRLFDRRRGGWTDSEIHEHACVKGRVGRLSGHLLHYSYRSLSDHEARMERYAALMARKLHENGRRGSVAQILINPAWRFVRGYLLRLGFIDGWRGLVFALVETSYVRRKYSKLYLLGRGLQI
jgi:glycosyltransferase involved in cell wall biosynthesis